MGLWAYKGKMYTKKAIWLHQIFCLIALMCSIADKAFRKTSTNTEHQGMAMIEMKPSRTIKSCHHHWINTQLQMIFHTKLKMVLKKKTHYLGEWLDHCCYTPSGQFFSRILAKKQLFDDMTSGCKRSTRLFRFL